MDEQYYLPVTTEYFCECLPLLEKYFGITAGYFNEELRTGQWLTPYKERGADTIIKYRIKENCNPILNFYHLDCRDLIATFNAYGFISPLLEEALLLVAYCICERKCNEAEYDDLVQYHVWDMYQSEWAKLYLFMEEMEQRETVRAEKNGSPNTSITIKTNTGMQEKVVIENTDNWLFRLIKKELADYFPDAQSAEDARQDIQRRKPKAGAKPMNAIYSAVAYGLYRMLHEENAIPENPDMPNELCKFIHDFTCFTGCYPQDKGWSGTYNPKIIRVDLASYLKRSAANKQIPRFRPIPLREEIITQNFEFRDLF